MNNTISPKSTQIFTITEDFINAMHQASFSNVQYCSGLFTCMCFPDESSKLLFYKSIGLCSPKSENLKVIYHKSSDEKIAETCTILGFNQYSKDNFTYFQLLIETESGIKIPINSMYLKDMQKSSFGSTLDTEG